MPQKVMIVLSYAEGHPTKREGKYRCTSVKTAARHIKSGWAKLHDDNPKKVSEAVTKEIKKAQKLTPKAVEETKE